jgi:hypothetical protein
MNAHHLRYGRSDRRHKPAGGRHAATPGDQASGTSRAPRGRPVGAHRARPRRRPLRLLAPVFVALAVLAASAPPAYRHDPDLVALATPAGALGPECPDAVCDATVRIMREVIDAGCTDDVTCADLADTLDVLLGKLNAFTSACLDESTAACATGFELARTVLAFAVECVNAVAPGSTTVLVSGSTMDVGVSCASIVRTAADLLGGVVALVNACATENDPTCTVALDLVRSLADYTAACVGGAGNELGVQTTIIGGGGFVTVDCAALVRTGAGLVNQIVALAVACANESEPACATALDLTRSLAGFVTTCGLAALKALGIEPAGPPDDDARVVALTVDCGQPVSDGVALAQQVVALARACADETNDTCAAGADLARAAAAAVTGCVAGALTALGVTVTFGGTTTLPVAGTTLDCAAVVHDAQQLLAELAALTMSCVEGTRPECAAALDLATAAAQFAVGCATALAAEIPAVTAAPAGATDIDCGAEVAAAKALLAELVAVVRACADGATATCATAFDAAGDAVDLVTGCLADAVVVAAPEVGLSLSPGGTTCRPLIEDAVTLVAALLVCVRAGTCGAVGPVPSEVPREPVDETCVACETQPMLDVTIAPTALRRVPGAPTSVTGAARDRAILVQWQPPSGGGVVDDYVVRVYADGQPAVVTEVALCSQCSSAYLTDLQNGVGYYADVRAHSVLDGYGASARTAVVVPRVATLADLPAALPFANVSAAGFTAGNVPDVTLSAAARADAISIVNADPRLSTLLALGGVIGYDVASVGPWTTIGSQRNIGAQVRLALRAPLNAHGGTIPEIEYDSTEVRAFPHYQQSLVQVDALNVREVVVLVDLTTRKAVAFELDHELDATVFYLDVVLPYPLPITMVVE